MKRSLHWLLLVPLAACGSGSSSTNVAASDDGGPPGTVCVPSSAIDYPSAVGICAPQGAGPASAPIVLTNRARCASSWRLEVEDGAPLDLSPNGGVLAPGESATVTVSARPGARGTHYLRISGDGLGSAISVEVNAASSALHVSTTSLDMPKDLTMQGALAAGDLVLSNTSSLDADVQLLPQGEHSSSGDFNVSIGGGMPIYETGVPAGGSVTLHVTEWGVGSFGDLQVDGTLLISSFSYACAGKGISVALHAHARDRAQLIGAGGKHTCVHGAANGTDWCWGDPKLIGGIVPGPANGGIGGAGGSSHDPEAALVAGRGHVCSLTLAPHCWGAGSLGQLGDGSLLDSEKPVQVYPFAPTTALFAGFDTSCGVDQKGAVLCWGRDPRVVDASQPLAAPTAIAVPSTPRAMAVGERHLCGVDAAGAVSCLGANDAGQLGNGTTTPSPTAVALVGVSDAAPVIVAGASHSCVLRTGGGVACWGNGARGQLGDGRNLSSLTPVNVAGLSDAVALSAGDAHTCALRKDGTLACWGANESGQLGDGTMHDRATPVAVVGLTNGAAIAAGLHHTCAIHHDGDVACWGDDSSAQLGTGTGMPGAPQSTPQPVFAFH